jgi:hypothetical protein
MLQLPTNDAMDMEMLFVPLKHLAAPENQQPEAF